MKEMKKLSAAVALALSMGVMSQAQAEIVLKNGGLGDALLFPAYNAYVENYFTINNNDNKWIQGHLRFRGAAWSGELLDFDIILSPGDVFVFRIADVDGDGYWEIDQSLDIHNFMYTGQVASCSPTVPNPSAAGAATENCMDFGTMLVPTSLSDVVTSDRVIHHLMTGYVEFIGEAVLDGMDAEAMKALLSDTPGAALAPHQTRAGNGRGVTAWSWSDAANQFAKDKGLSDVPNMLSGTAFVTLPGSSHGLSYNAESLVNFRTGMTAHRIDNYRMNHNKKDEIYVSLDDDGTRATSEKTRANRAVIVHDEDVNGKGIADPYKPYGDYVFRFESFRSIPSSREDRLDESRMSFQNTWGPTLADGDDYLLAGLRPTYDTPDMDDFDADWRLNPFGYGVTNSIAEVEEAVRKDGQSFIGFYFDNGALPQAGAGLTSQYFAYFPTKVFWSELYDEYNQTSFAGYLQEAVQWLLTKSKGYHLELWDHQEREACRKSTTSASVSPFQPGASGCTVTTSPSFGCQAPDTPVVTTAQCEVDLGFELNFFDINDVKSRFPSSKEGGFDLDAEFQIGRVVFEPYEEYNDTYQDNLRQSWPALMYGFEWSGDGHLAHWRSLHR